MPKRLVALARVSSREQEREGFSLDVQVDAFEDYARRESAELARVFRIAETATKQEERTSFRELLDYINDHASEIDGVLFYKVDRAARNLYDYVEIERLEESTGVPVIYITQPTENTPAGRMMRRTLANMAAFYTEQQSLDVREGTARRVQNGLFCGKAPYGYKNVRVDGRSVVAIDTAAADNVRRSFEFYAYHGHTLDTLGQALVDEGRSYSPTQSRFPRSKLHTILRDRSYLGELPYKGRWLDGAHPALVDISTFERVQVLLGEKTYANHESVYGAGLIECGHCGHPVVVDIKAKQTKAGVREYI